jgi:nucleoside-diphosphate-sugar epimerase
MPRVLIAGCGYLGQAVAELLLTQGWQVEGWTKSPRLARECVSYPIRPVDISSHEDVLAHKSDFDAVVHSASTRGGDSDSYRRVYVDGVRNLIGCFGNSRILFTGSTSVYAQTNGEWVSEESPAEPRHETGNILREAEEAVLAARGVIARLGGIYGPGRSALLNKFLEGRAVLDSENDHFVNQIHRDDAAIAMFLLVDSAPAAGQTYNVVDNEPILESECYRWLAAKLSRPLPSEKRPTRLWDATATQVSTRKRGESNKRVSNAKLRALGWAPRYPNFAEGMQKSVLLSLNREGP